MLKQIQRFDPLLAVGWENLLDDVNDAHQRIDALEEHSRECQRELESHIQYLERIIEELLVLAKASC